MQLTVDSLSKSISIIGTSRALTDHLCDLKEGVLVSASSNTVFDTDHSIWAGILNLAGYVAVTGSVTIVALHQAWVADAVVACYNLRPC